MTSGARRRRHRSRLALADLADEASASILARPTRTLLTALGTVLGIAALVATAGLTTTAGNHIVSRFDELAATEVVVAPASAAVGGQASGNVLPWDAEARLTPLNGVVAAGTMTEIDLGGQPLRTTPRPDPRGRTDHQVPLFAGSPGLLDALRGTVRPGRSFDWGHDQRADRVAVVGRAAADRLDLGPLDRLPAVFVGATAFTVIGLLDDVDRAPELLDAVIIPDNTARRIFGLAAPDEVHVHTRLGAARLIGSQAPLALAPQAFEQLAARVPPEPEQVRARVADDVRALLLLLGGLALLIGGLGIANTTLVGVLERTHEIGLRRSLGAYRSHIAAQFLVESTAIGFLGGLVGTSLGVLVTVGVSAVRHWDPVLEPALPPLTVLAGAVIGLAAGTYPAWRAAGTEPITALRTEA